MASPPDPFSGADLIPHLTTSPGSSSYTTPLGSTPPSPTLLPTSDALHRSRTAPPPTDAISTSPPLPVHDATTTVTPHSALRRTSSSLSAGSQSGSGSREKKRLRFTPLTDPHAESSTSAVGGAHSLDDAEAGRPSGKGKRGVPRDQQGYLTSDPGTPNLVETADQIRRTLSLASVDSLLLLSANPSGERERLIKEVSRAGKELVWRGQGEQKLFPKDAERAWILALKRGLRSFILAFCVRAGVNVLLMLFRTLRRKRLRFALFWHAIFGAESFRFGGMIGTFTYLNTLTLHLLRLAPPLSYMRRRLRAGIFNRPTFGPPEREGAEGESRWQAAVAGAVGSLGLLWETKARRRGVAQQMFVRGLQASYNLYTPQYGIHVPHGDLLVFGLCCGQIMFAFLLSPETIPKEYSNWIQKASRVPEFGVLGNRMAVRQGIVEPALVEQALAYKGITKRNASVLEGVLQRVKQGWRPNRAVPCEMVHPWSDSCTQTGIERFFSVFRLMLPVYSALHLIPTLVLRRHHVQRAPLRMLARAVWGITRSCSFLGVFVMIYQMLFCLRTQALEQGFVKGWLSTLLKRKETFWMIGFSTCLSLLVEEKKRRAELAMYVLPRALESAWSSARKRAYVPIVPFGETILGAAAMAMVMDAYKHQPAAMSGIVRRLLYQIVGPV